MTSTLTDHLRALPDGALASLLARRPDLITPPASDLAALAARAQSRVSVARALEGLDLFTLEILDACRLARTPAGTTSVNAVLTWAAGTDPDAVRAALDRLAELSVIYGPADDLQVVPTVDEICSPHPAGLGRPAADLVNPSNPGVSAPWSPALGSPSAGTTPAVAADGSIAEVLAADPARLRRTLLAATPAGRAVLDRLAAGPPVGTASPAAITNPESTVGALVAAGLLVATGDDTVELPREVAFALRRDRRLGLTHPLPPGLGTASRPVKTIDTAGAGQAMEAARHTASLLEALDEEPAGMVKTGGLAVRDLRRLAKAAEITEPVAAVLLEVAAAAGLIGESDPASGGRAGAEPRFLVTLTYDAWAALPTAEQWVRLARAWLAMSRQPGLTGRKPAPTEPTRRLADRDRPASVLGPDIERTGAPRLRAAVLAVLAEAPAGSTPSFEDLLSVLHWRAPRRSPWQPGGADPDAADPVRWTLDEASLLGFIGLGGLTSYARALLTETAAGHDPDDDPLGVRGGSGAAMPAVAMLDRLLPAPVDHFLLQADLTVVVPGPPEPALAAELAVVAERESAGGASVYRVTPGRIRYALDTGYQPAELHKLFAGRSRTPVPQALTYLIDDVARRHGGLRAGSAGCYLRSEDAALLAEIAADKRLSGLSLRALAPTVLVSPFLVGRVIGALREAGHAPVPEDGTGSVTVGRTRALRAPGRRTAPVTPVIAPGRGPSPAQLAALVEALRKADAAARSTRRPPVATVRPVPEGLSATHAHTQAMAVLQQAIRDKRPVWVGYVDAHGATASRLLRPVSMSAGYLRAEDERTEMLHTLALHRITAVVPDA